MSNVLSEYNSRQLSGLSANQTELIYVKQLINSLALTGNVNAKTVLMEVQFSDYTPAIVRLVKEALTKFE
jgi:prefoldin subunit 5